MAATITFKRKCYSDDEKKGMSTGTKIALGTAATTGLAAGALSLASKGKLGNAAMLRSNRMINQASSKMANFGKAHNFKSIESIGNGGVNYGSKGAATARQNILEKGLEARGGTKLTNAQRDASIWKNQQREMTRYGADANSVKTQNLNTSNQRAWQANNVDAESGAMWR